MVLAYHLIWTGYGWWLPNDPRGSGSRCVASDLIADLGEPHYGRKPIQPPSKTIREFYGRAVDVLKYPPLRFNDKEIQTIAAAFGVAIAEHRYTCYACAILPDHVHLVIRKHRDKAEAMIDNLQRASRLRLVGANAVDENHPVWTEGGWKVFLDSPNSIRGRIRYVEANPIRAKLGPQRWPFVVTYDGWPRSARIF